jgi:hypothetical protein
MAQMIVGRPFKKLELTHQHGLEPAAFFHLCGRKSLSPAPAAGFGQVRKRALCCFQPLKLPKQLLARRGREPVASSGDIDEFVAIVIAEDQSIEVPGA